MTEADCFLGGGKTLHAMLLGMPEPPLRSLSVEIRGAWQQRAATAVGEASRVLPEAGRILWPMTALLREKRNVAFDRQTACFTRA